MCAGEWNKERKFIYTVVKAFRIKLLAEIYKSLFLVSVLEAHLKL